MLPEPTIFFLLCQKQQPGWPVVDADKIAHELLADKEGRAVKNSSWSLAYDDSYEGDMSHEKRAPGWLGDIGDYTTQLYRDYNKPL